MKFIALLTLAVSALAAQTFEVASVKRAVSETGQAKSSGATIPAQTDPTRINYPGVTLKSVIALAYGVGPDQIAGPRWLNDERYDIAATLPAGASQAGVPVMLQHLLAERFSLTIHEQTKSKTGYALTLAASKGPLKMRSVENGHEATIDLMSDRIQLTNYSMADFAGFLSSSTGRPVADQTGIQGRYDIALYSSMADLQSVLAVRAVQQLGLKLETSTVPAKFIVVDKVDRIPTGN